MSRNDHAGRLREMAEYASAMATAYSETAPHVSVGYERNSDALTFGADALERVEVLERERNQLYNAMREVCRIAGGWTADGVSVDFLMLVPAEVAAALAEARKSCPCRQRDARIDAAMEEN